MWVSEREPTSPKGDVNRRSLRAVAGIFLPSPSTLELRLIMPKERALFLIDGSNFYYALQEAGLKKGDIDYRQLALHLARNREVVAIRFFICPVLPAGSPQAKDQQRFFSALRRQGVTIRLGTLVKRSRTCPSCGAVQGYRMEKGVDVLLAMDMVSGAIEDKYDVVYLVSCDADFAPVVEYVRVRGKKVFLVAPKGAKYGSLGNSCDVAIPIDQKVINACQGNDS
ncbi:MAG: NYN domain-containing protein [Thermodesulfobacteriota bacterium]